jgi:c-di-GMP-binding flagellar brake protein YcgR
MGVLAVGMDQESHDILADAVARNSAAVLSLPSAGMLRHHKSRFLAQTADGLWIESAPADIALIEELRQQQIPVGISFKAVPNKASFAVPILRRDQSYQLNASSVVEALLLQSPAKIKPVQRRNHYRVKVPEGAPLSVRVWRIADHVLVRDRPLASQLVAIHLRDISVGGLGVMLNRDTEDRALLSGQRLRIELKWEDVELILEGSLRIVEGAQAAESVRAGIQFKKLENDLAGRQAIAVLTRIVGEFQREEVRRSRLGL